MDKKNLVRLFMFQTVFGFATRNQLITSMIVAYKNGISYLGDIINQLLVLSGSQSTVAVGSGSEADYYRSLLDNMSANNLKAARGWALSINKMDLAKKFDYPLTRISKISNKNLNAITTAWIELITTELPNLAHWGYTQITLDDWNQMLLKFNATFSLPKNTIETRKQNGIKINELIKLGMAHCDNVLDTSAVGFKTNGNLDFYNQYKGFRKLTPVASKKGKIRVFVMDDLMQPVNNITITQDGTDNSITTGINGEASLDIIYNKGKDKNQRDIYSFTLKSGTKTINTGSIQIKHNETVTRVIVMEPTGFVIPAYQNKKTTAKVPA